MCRPLQALPDFAAAGDLEYYIHLYIYDLYMSPSLGASRLRRRRLRLRPHSAPASAAQTTHARPAAEPPPPLSLHVRLFARPLRHAGRRGGRPRRAGASMC